VLVLATLFAAPPARSDEPQPDSSASGSPKPGAPRLKRLVFHVEAVGIDVPSVRARLRDSIPQNVIVVDADEFRAAMRAAGQTDPVGKSYPTPSERPALFARLRRAMRETPADGLVILLMYDTPKLRVARVLVLFESEDEPVLDQLLTLDPAKAKTDAAVIRASLGPVLEQFAEPEPAPSEAAAPAAEPLPIFSPSEGPPPKPPPPAVRSIFAGLLFRLFPGLSTYNLTVLRVGVPIGKTLMILPAVGGVYRPRPQDDFGYVAGGAFRALPKPGWFVDVGAIWAEVPKILRFVQPTLTGGATFGKNEAEQPLARVTLQANFVRALYPHPPSPPDNEINMLSVGVTGELRPTSHLWISPNAAVNFYDRDLSAATGGFAPLTLAQAAYPWDSMYGGFIGWDTGRFLPMLGARVLSYSGNIGHGVAVAPGVRYSDGPDFFDLRVALFFNDTKGRLSNPLLDLHPIVGLDVGLTF
jgi:hypothetical protein